MADKNFNNFTTITQSQSTDCLVGYIPSNLGYVVGVNFNNNTNYGVTITSVDVVFSGGGGSGAAATAQFSGSYITGVTVTDPGAGYTSPPYVNFLINNFFYASPAPVAQMGGFTNKERSYSVNALANFITKNYTANISQNTSTINSNQYSEIDMAQYAIKDSPSTAKAWINFNGYANTESPSKNSNCNWTYVPSTGVVTVTLNNSTRTTSPMIVGNTIYVSDVSYSQIQGYHNISAKTVANSFQFTIAKNLSLVSNNGTLSYTPIIIKSSYNIASLSRTALGTYQIIFTNNLNSSNYSYMGMTQSDAESVVQLDGNYNGNPILKNNNQMQFNVDGNANDNSDVSLIIFGN